jgi:hypothetical protein
VGGASEGPDHIGKIVAHLHVTDFDGGAAYTLHYDGDGAFDGVGLGDGERYAFAFLIGTYNDEIARFACLGYEGCLEYELVHFVRKLTLFYYSVHATKKMISIGFVFSGLGFKTKPQRPVLFVRRLRLRIIFTYDEEK